MTKFIKILPIFILMSLMIVPVYASILASLAPHTACTTTCSTFTTTSVNPQTLEYGTCVSVLGGTVTNVTFTLKRGAGNPTSGTITVGSKIYSVSGNPNANSCVITSALGTSSTTIDYGSLTSSFVTYNFIFTGISLSSGQNIFVSQTITSSVGNNCTGTCNVVVPFNLNPDSTQSGMDNFPTAMGVPGAPNNAGDNTLCSSADFCLGYTLNGIPSPNTTTGQVINTQIITGSSMFGPLFLATFAMLTIIIVTRDFSLGGFQQGLKFLKLHVPFLVLVGVMFLVFVALTKGIT